MSGPIADRNLLFGILALQMDFIGRDDLLAAMNAWVLDKTKPLGDILLEQGALRPDNYDLLEALVRRHLEMHGNDPQRSLAVVSSMRSVRQDLERIADAAVQASVLHVATTPPTSDPNATTPGGGTVELAGRRYRVLRPHARGGLGEVFVARDEELRREVALKEMRPEGAADTAHRARFLLEAEVTGGLEHPGIVPVYGLGTYGDGRPFYAMRLIKGDSLKDAVERYHSQAKDLSPGARAVQLRALLRRFLDVCDAIAYAHSRGVLHRDLKPGNIMVGKYGETLVVDWGLAKVIDKPDVENTEGLLTPSLSGDSARTHAGTALGTPAYMSPEQAAGQLDKLGPPTDVYGLGATLYSVLTGRSPVIANDIGAVLDKVQKGDIPRPRELERHIPAALEAICLKAMALKPEDRYASPRALADDLERWLADEPVTAYREPLLTRLNRWRRRHNTMVTAAALVLLTLTGASVVGGLVVSRAQGRTRALGQVEALANASAATVPALLKEVAAHGADVRTRLRQKWDGDLTDAQRLRVGLALADDADVRTHLIVLARKADDPQEVLLVRDALVPHAAEVNPPLWEQVKEAPAVERFRLLAILATLDPESAEWPRQAEVASEQFLASNPLHLGPWKTALEPVRVALLGPLGKAFRDSSEPERRRLSATLLADYAADRPDLLADLLLDADEQLFAVLLPKVQQHRERGMALLLAELDKKATFRWDDKPLDASWKSADAALVQRLEAAQGLVDERFAFCQTLPLDEFLKVAEGLRPAGYRPVRMRPFAHGGAVRVAALWARDGRDWRLAHDLTAGALAAKDAEEQKQSYRPADAAGYLTEGKERYAVVWVRGEGAEEAKIHVGAADATYHDAGKGLLHDGFRPVTSQVLTLPEGGERYVSVWRKPWPLGSAYWEDSEQDFADRLELDVELPVDVSVRFSDEPLCELARDAVSWLAGPPWAALGRRSVARDTSHPRRRYATTWQADGTREAVDLRGLDSAAHRARGRELIAQGYRPAALSVAGEEALMAASVWHRPVVAEEAKERLAKRQASAGVALLRLGQLDRVWPLLKHSPDPRVRSYLLARLGVLGADPEALLKRLDEEREVSVRRALLLGLGEFGEKEMPPARREALLPGLLALYRDDPDAGVHGSVTWLLRQWGQREKLKEIDKELIARDKALASGVASAPREGAPRGGERLWYVNGQGQTMVVIPGPSEFLMGSPRTEAGRWGGPESRVEQRHEKRIGRTYALAAHEVTVEQFQRFRWDHDYDKTSSPTPDHPVLAVTWYEAAEYCNWLSKEEGLPKDQWCYEPNPKGAYAEGMRIKKNYLSLTGYRLPSEAEWEHACRAGAATARHYGETEDLLGRYACYNKVTSGRKTLPVGSLRPNDLGLVDVLGNGNEWCQEKLIFYMTQIGNILLEDEKGIGDIRDSDIRVWRSSYYGNVPGIVRSAMRVGLQPAYRATPLSFRPARTMD